MQDKIENCAGRLIELSKKEKLSRDEVEEARKLMTKLRKMGMSSKEIEELTGGRWKESTVRGYVRGIAAGNEWKSEASLLRELVSAGLTIEDVKQVISISRQIDVDALIDALSRLKAKGLSPEDLINSYRALKEHGLSPADVRDVIEYKRSLESIGFSLDSLAMIKDEAEKAGSPESILAKISAYRDLKELEEERAKLERQVKEIKAQLDSLEEKMKSMEKEKARLEVELSKARQSLDVFRELEGMGYSIDVLERLRKVAASFDVFKALEKYRSLEEIESEIDSRKSELEKIKAEIGKLRKKYRHELEICSEIEKLGFDLPSLNSLASMLRNYDKRHVFDAVSRYKSLKELEEEMKRMRTEVERLQREHAHLSELSELFNSLLEKGIGLSFIEQLQRLAGKYSAEEIMKMVEKAREIKELEAEIERLEKEKSELEGKIESLRKSHSHLSEQLSFCNSLLEKFGVEGIESLQKLSARYSPKEVFKGLEKYKEMKELENEIRAKKKELRALEEQIEENKALLSRMHDEIRKLVEDAAEAGKKIGEIEARIEESEEVAKLLKFIKRPKEFDKEFVKTHIAPIIDALEVWISERGEISFPSLAAGHARELAKAIRE